MLKEKPANEYLKDPGVSLVNQYAEIKAAQKLANMQWDMELAKLEEALISFAEHERIEVVFGSKNKVRITETEKLSFPSKNSTQRRQLEDLLRSLGKFEEVSQLDTTALGKIIEENVWEPDLLSTVKQFVNVEQKKRLYLSQKKET
jgi:hypothetical protein